MWADEKTDFEDIVEHEAHKSKRFLTINAFVNFWPRLTATSFAWIANGEAECLAFEYCYVISDLLLPCGMGCSV